MTYQPKGGMCINCQFKLDDCSEMDFKSMQRLGKPDGYGVIIVKCYKFKRINDKSDS